MTTASTRVSADPRLDELAALQQRLLQASRAWARGQDLGPEVTEARHAALRLQHERYAALIPVYRELAEPIGATGPVPVEILVDNLMFSGLFKSYEPERLATGDFAGLVEWLQRVSTGVPSVDLTGLAGIGDWRARLRQAGMFLSFSSGTSGRMSFVPRDLATFRALAGNGAHYADPSMPMIGFDCLVLGPRGDGIGLLDAGNGLARAAVRSHFLFDQALTADAVRGGAGWIDRTRIEEADTAAVTFLQDAARDEHPVLVFGAPFQVRRFCARVLGGNDRVTLPKGSLLVTGGGWKTFAGERLTRGQLLDVVRDALAISPERCLDSYSTAEINASLTTCRAGRYHVPPLLEAVVLDEALTGVPGQAGQGLLGFLDPFAGSYPGFVITGDRATLAFGKCECGRGGAFLDGEIERAPGAEIRGCGGLLGSMLA
jgi:hypothetical protein